jgi:hypothetical protein
MMLFRSDQKPSDRHRKTATVLGNLLKVRRAKRAAIAVIEPFLAHSRTQMDPLPHYAWLEPHPLGFVTMLVTLLARNAVGNISSASLAMVQAETISALLDLEPEFAGEVISSLSMARDADFEEGSRAGIRFFCELAGVDLTIGTGQAGLVDAIDQVVRAAEPVQLNDQIFSHMLKTWLENIDQQLVTVSTRDLY